MVTNGSVVYTKLKVKYLKNNDDIVDSFKNWIIKKCIKSYAKKSVLNSFNT